VNDLVDGQSEVRCVCKVDHVDGNVRDFPGLIRAVVHDEQRARVEPERVLASDDALESPEPSEDRRDELGKVAVPVVQETAKGVTYASDVELPTAVFRLVNVLVGCDLVNLQATDAESKTARR